MEKKEPDIGKLVSHFKERRRELAQEMRDTQLDRKNHENDHLDSYSRYGKAMELTICNRFNAVHENNRDRVKL